MIAPPVTAIASQLAGEQVSVSCERNQRFQSDVRAAYTVQTTYTDGSVVFSPVIHLAAATCNALNRLVIIDRRPQHHVDVVQSGSGQFIDLADGNAVHLLLHEATHIRDDSTDEARVECDTSRNAWSAVKLFHLAAWQDRQILRGMAVAHLDSVPSYLLDC